MREIKFRAWNGFTMTSDNFCLTKEGEPFYFGTEMMGDIKVDVPIPYGKADLELMQFTGLRDKNGKEIYEGDLIKDSDSNYIGEVVWDNETLCFTTRFQSNELWGFVPRHGKDNHCVVIGNIYENLELLEVNNAKSD